MKTGLGDLQTDHYSTSKRSQLPRVK